MADIVAKVPKPPQMRGLYMSFIKKHLAIASVLAIAGAVAYKVCVAEPRKAKYAEFYRNYDAEKEFQIMKSKGLFQSCK